MKVNDYLQCAKKHLDFCRESVVSSKNESLGFLIDVYYMLGYVFEGFAVYMAYKIPYTERGRSDVVLWDEANDVEFFDRSFTRASMLAYEKDYNRVIEDKVNKANNQGCLDTEKDYEYYINTKFDSQVPKCNSNQKMGEWEFIKKLKKEYNEECKNHFYVKGHEFNRRGKLVEKVIRPYFLEREGKAVHSEGKIPYFGTSDCDAFFTKECKALIQAWTTGLRYSHEGDSTLENDVKEKITRKNIDGLISVCDKIFELIPHYFSKKRV